jgi:hypothetical protein
MITPTVQPILTTPVPPRRAERVRDFKIRHSSQWAGRTVSRVGLPVGGKECAVGNVSGRGSTAERKVLGPRERREGDDWKVGNRGEGHAQCTDAEVSNFGERGKIVMRQNLKLAPHN